jgi:hypothetical protein
MEPIISYVQFMHVRKRSLDGFMMTDGLSKCLKLNVKLSVI